MPNGGPRMLLKFLRELYGSPGDFSLRIVGDAPGEAIVRLYTLGTWNPGNPIGRDALVPVDSFVADSNGVLRIADTYAHWGTRYDIVVHQADYLWSGWLPNVRIWYARRSVRTQHPKLVPYGLGGLGLALGPGTPPYQNLWATDLLWQELPAVWPPPDWTGILVRRDGETVCQGTLFGGFSAEAYFTLYCMDLGPVTVEVWLYNPVRDDYAVVGFNVEDPQEWCT